MFTAHDMKGAGAVDYYIGGGGDAASKVASYYLDPQAHGEPRGFWHGSGAAVLGLEGEIDDAEFRAVFAEFKDPRDARFADPGTRDEADVLGSAQARYRTAEDILAAKLAAYPGSPPPEDMARMQDEAAHVAGRRVNLGWDLTYSPPKDFTLALAAAGYAELQAQRAGDLEGMNLWAGRQAALRGAAHEANRTAMGWAERNAAYTRATEAGATRHLSTSGFTSAGFEQHDNRAGAPQFHIHNPTLNRVQGSDGKWRALDGDSVTSVRQGMSAIGDRTLRESLESMGYKTFTREDGVTWALEGIDDKHREIASERSKTINAKAQEWVGEFRERYNREPTALELNRMKEKANLATRASKQPAASVSAQLDKWDAQIKSEVSGGLQLIADRHRDLTPPSGVSDEEWSRRDVIVRALDAVQAEKSTWSKYELMRHLEPLLPSLGGRSAEDVTALLEGLAEEALEQDFDRVVQVKGRGLDTDAPAQLRRADGRIVYDSPTAARYALASHMSGELALQRLGIIRDRHQVDADTAKAAVARYVAGQDPEQRLSLDQRAAATRLLTGGARLTTFIGPAGTGKSTVMGALTDLWAETTGGRVFGVALSQQATNELKAAGVERSLNVRQFVAAHERIDDGNPMPGDRDFILGPSDKLVIDEMSMASTATLLEVIAIADRAGAAVIGTGDPFQMGAVGAGGVMSDLAADPTAEVITLSTVHRFTADWEGAASMALRDGSEDVVREYDRHGRLYAGGTAEETRAEAARQFVAARLQGKTAAVTAETNDEADQLSAIVREGLVAAGVVEAEGLALGLDGNTAGIGDVIACREVDHGLGVANREKLEVVTVHADGSVDATTPAGTLKHLPAQYVAEKVSLGYASTIHGVQGATVDIGITVASAQTSRESLYTGMTRGRESNVIVARTVAQDHEGHVLEGDPVTAASVVRDVLDQEAGEKSAHAIDVDETERLASARTVGGQLEDGLMTACRERTERALDRLAAEGLMTEDDRAAFRVDQGTKYLSNLLRTTEQAGHDPDQVLRDAVTVKSFKDAQSVAQVTAGRIHNRDLDLTPEAGRVPVAGIGPEWNRHLDQLREKAEGRAVELGERVAQEQPAWVVAALGELPSDEAERAAWVEKAATVAQAREWVGWEDETRPLGPSPSAARPEGRAQWFHAWEALGKPQAVAEEGQMSEGRLRARVASFERLESRAPVFVDEHLKATALRAAEAAREAAFLAAQGDEETARKAADEAALLEATARSLDDSARARDDYYERATQEREIARRAAEELKLRDLPAVGAEPDRATTEQHLDELRPIDSEVITEIDVAEDALTVEDRAALDSGPHADAAEVLPRQRVAVERPTLEEGIPSPEDVAAVEAVAEEWAEDELDWESRMQSPPAEEDHDEDHHVDQEEVPQEVAVERLSTA